MKAPVRTFAFFAIMCILKVITILTLVCLVWGDEACITPVGTDGICIPLMMCDKLKVLVKGTAADREYLKHWHCAFDGLDPRVCCPLKNPITSTNDDDETTTTTRTTTTTTTTTSTTTTAPPKGDCITLESTFGNCIALTQCPSMNKRLLQPTPEDLKYVQRSRCLGEVHYSVCCDMNDQLNRQAKPLTGDRYSSTANKSANLGSNRNSQCQQISGLPEPNSNCCGVESGSGNKIINGEPTAIDQYPWLAMIEYIRPYLCGGSLISSRYVLTAAHCIVTANKLDRNAKSVRLGDYDVTHDGIDCVEVEGDGEDCNDGAISIAIASKIVHPEYNNQNIIVQANDIALLKLKEQAPYTDFIRPICLPSLDITKSPPRDLRFYVAGWGAVNETIFRSNIKLHIDVPFVKKEDCKPLYSRLGFSLLWEKHMCAGGEFNKDSCKGDSGGPLMYLNEKIIELTGIISFGIVQCGNRGQPSIYTNVHDYLPWIKSIVNS